MLEKLVGQKIELMPRILQENEMLCETCGGTGWLYEKEKGYIERCPVCYSGVIHICSICHQPVRGICTNEHCRKLRDDENEKKLFDKAIKATYEEVPNESKEMMYSDRYLYNEGYFTELDEFIEYCNDEDISLPDYVWSTRKTKLSIDAGNIIENACEELHEDAYQNIEHEKELQDFLDAWCDKQSGVDSYSVDYKYAIKVSD